MTRARLSACMAICIASLAANAVAAESVNDEAAGAAVHAKSGALFQPLSTAGSEVRRTGSAVPERSDPLQLSDSQMDAVAAGAQISIAGGAASAWLGWASSASQANTVSSGSLKYTSASSVNLAVGIGASAHAWGNSAF